MRKHKIMALLLIAVLVLSGCVSQNGNKATSEIPEETTQLSISELTPANDYYGYINAKELMELDLKPGDTANGPIRQMSEKNEETLNNLIDDIAKSSANYPAGSNGQLIRDLYNLTTDFCNENPEKDKSDEELIAGLLERTNAVNNMEEMVAWWSELYTVYNISSVFASEVTPDIYQNDRYVLVVSANPVCDLESLLDSDSNAAAIRDTLKERLCLAGLDATVAKDRATNIIYMLNEIAGQSTFQDEDEKADITKNYVYYSKDEIMDHLSNVSYEQICSMLGFTGRTPDELSIPDITQFYFIESTFNDEHLQEWKDITTCVVLSDDYGFFPNKYRSGKADKERADKIAREVIKVKLENQLAEEYLEKCYDKRKTDVAARICNELKEEYYSLIGQADWMSEEGKAYCKRKLDYIEFYIGGPEEGHPIDPRDADLIKDTALQTCMALDTHQSQKNRDKFFQKVKTNYFEEMTPTTINAAYGPQFNAIIIPAAFMGIETLNPDMPYEWNLGRLGSVIGHEISHGFDSEGIRFDEHGNFRPDAMPQEDIDAFKELQDNAIAYYDTFTVLGSHVSGQKTLAENLADISGVQACLSIAKTPEKQKMVLEAYANLWSELQEDTFAKDLLAADTHSPARIRVNAVVALFDCFYEIYGVGENDPMYVAPEDRVRRW